MEGFPCEHSCGNRPGEATLCGAVSRGLNPYCSEGRLYALAITHVNKKSTFVAVQ